MSAAEDQADVSRVLGGDVAAFEGIVRRWQGPLINLAWRFCRDRGRAEDMAQEAFLRAFRSLKTWRGEGAFSTWLFAVATNLYRTEIRRIPPNSLPLDLIAEPKDSRPLDGGLELRDRDETIRRAILGLPAKYRDVVVVFYFKEKDLEEAALSLGIPQGTLKVRLFRAREILRRKLGHLFGPQMEGHDEIR